MLKYILIGFVVLIVGIGVAASMQPDTFSVSRSQQINAAPSAVFAEVNDLRRWEDWSPWAKLDPNATSTFSGPAAGEGASMAWDGNHEIGKGTMTIIESTAPSLVRLRLDFLKPMESTSESIFQFQQQDGGTLVTWTMSGENNFMAKVISLVMNCEEMVGGYFEKGLGSLQSVVEAK